MKRRIWIVFSLVLIGGIFLISDRAFSAWTQPKGHAYNQLTYSFFVSDHKFSTVKFGKNDVYLGIEDDADRVKQARFTSHSLTYYGEYGITDKLTVFAAIPYKWTKSDDAIRWSGENGPRGIGDIDTGLRYKLSNNLFGSGVLMSVQGTVKIPKAYTYGNPLTHLSLGDGQFDTTLALVFGKGFGKGYAIINAGYKYRFENDKFDPIRFKPSDQVKIFIGGGYAIHPKLSLRGSIDWTISVGNAWVSKALIVENFKYGGLARQKDDVLIRDTLALQQDVMNLGVALAYNITQRIQTVLSYNFDVEGIGIFKTEDAGQGQTYSLALVYIY